MDRFSFNALDLDEIVEHVLKFLPMRVLQNSARVSRQWYRIASKIKASRKQLTWLLYQDDETNCFEYLIAQHLEYHLSEPVTALVFCSYDLYKKPLPAFSGKGSRKRQRLLLTNYLKQLLPPSCQLLGLTADGIIGTCFSQSSPVELEDSKAISCLLLPQLDGVEICSFELTEGAMSADWPNVESSNTVISDSLSESTEENRQFSDADVDNITGLSSDENVRLILLLLTDKSCDEFASALMRRYHNSVVIAGGYGYDLLSGNAGCQRLQDNMLSSGLGIVFCGGRISVTSIVLPASVRDPNTVKQFLKRLRSASASSPSSRSSIGLMFACVSRGQEFYEQPGVESKAFSELYPGVPLLGFFGDGEIGFDSPAEKTAVDCSSDSSSVPQLFHFKTSVFVMISFI